MYLCGEDFFGSSLEFIDDYFRNVIQNAESKSAEYDKRRYYRINSPS